MKITKNNYEVYFIDYYDGNLNAEQAAELFYFLESNPDLKSEFNNFSTMSLDIPDLHFPDRESLKKTEEDLFINDEKLISLLEGDILDSEKNSLTTRIQSNANLNKTYQLYKATVSVPDYAVVFPAKKSLKKPVPFLIAYRNEIRYGIAAILLIAFMTGMVTVFTRVMEETPLQVAEEITPTVPIIKPALKSGSETEVLPSATQQQNKSTNKISSQPGQLFADKKSSSGNAVKPVTDSSDSTINIKAVPELIKSEMIESALLPSIQDTINIAIQQDNKNNKAKPVTVTSNEEYLTVWEALRQSSEKNLKKILAKDEPVLALAEESDNSKTRIVDVVSKGLQKVSNDKVKLDAARDSKRFSFSAGNFSVERK